uniref:N-acetylgalactosaminide beta-1,3-galactosyltransferase n=1 Tax=Parastrongyloides trichosuri TaxID=131310 RepID=A0A0N4ZVT6_PARTI
MKENHESKAIHVKATWAKRCNKYIFISSETNVSLHSIDINITKGRDHLWAKTKAAFKHIYKHYINDYDWFLKADDDTYVVLENLRFMLLPHRSSEPIYFGCRFKPYVKQGYMSGGAGYVLSKENLRFMLLPHRSSEPIYFGCRFKPYVKQGYMSGGAGYVLSKEAVKRLVTQGLENNSGCSTSDGGAEDVNMGSCLYLVGVKAGDSRDSKDMYRFLPLDPLYHILPFERNEPGWFWTYVYYPFNHGLSCCSEFTISFHYINKKTLYLLEFLIYKLNYIGRESFLLQKYIFDNVDKERNVIEEEITKGLYNLAILYMGKNDTFRKTLNDSTSLFNQN